MGSCRGWKGGGKEERPATTPNTTPEHFHPHPLPQPQSELGRLQQREQVLGLKVKELREELAGSRKDGCRLKRALKTVEVRLGGYGRLWAAAAAPVQEALQCPRQVPFTCDPRITTASFPQRLHTSEPGAHSPATSRGASRGGACD